MRLCGIVSLYSLYFLQSSDRQTERPSSLSQDGKKQPIYLSWAQVSC